MKSRNAQATLVLAALAVAVGCLPDPAPPPPQPKPKPKPNAQVAVDPTPEPPPGMTREKAEVGAGVKGQYEPGIITTPASTYFRARERITFDIQIVQAMNLFKATKERAPKSHEEFVKEILEANRIVLPELPAGHTYVYDPKTAELMIQQPQ